MTDHWYYTHDGKNKIGPVPFAVLQQLAASGALHPNHMVLHEGGENRWVQAKAVLGLFPEATVQPPLAMPAEPSTPTPLGQTIKAKAGELWTKFLALPKNTRYAVLGGGTAGFLLMTCFCCGIMGFIGGKGGGGSFGGGGSAIKVNSWDLIKAYKANEAAANAKYQGKVIEVHGTIKKVTQEWVELEGWGEFELVTVDCHFDDPSILAGFSVGRQVEIRDTCEGATPFAVNVRDCKVVWKQ